MSASDFLFPLIAIQPETVREAYLRSGARPTQWKFHERGYRRDRECPYFAAFQSTPDILDKTEPAFEYAWSFIAGVVSADESDFALATKFRALAYSHGKACWEAVKDLAEGGAS